MGNESLISAEDIRLFNKGEHCRCYEFLGAHFIRLDGVEGVRFALWAPEVRSVSVIGTFNGWRGGEHPMSQAGDSGIWTAFVPGLQEGELYKYLIETGSGELLYKADPLAFSAELRPGTASRLARLDGYEWRDDAWLRLRAETPHFERPMNIYEAHLGSWKRRGEEKKDFLTYRELAEELAPYARDMGYSYIELLPVMEHPLDGSWGYQVTGFFAPTSRYGPPQDLMHFIDACHRAGLGVILDWVPGHFCRDAHGLGRFNGRELYEGGDHAVWGTYRFDFGRAQVRSFLLSGALFWMDRYHADGLRVDGVSSMLYLNFGESGGGRRNRLGGIEDLDAVAFLKELNRTIGLCYPDVFTAAEESSAWPLVTRPPEAGGLGFHYKWDMGWMNDTLRYMSADFSGRAECHRLLTFPSMYAFSENFVNPLSHDEVVHGKRSLIGRMPGDYRLKFAGLRLLALYQMCHPGAKLNFMGNELAQFIEWRYYEGLEWFLLDYEAHAAHRLFIKELNRLYLERTALWEYAYDARGFSWIEADTAAQSVLAFMRRGKKDDDFIVAVLNFRPVGYEVYRIGVPAPGRYRELLNSDDGRYGGGGLINPGVLPAGAAPMHGREYSVEIRLPPLGGVLLEYLDPEDNEDGDDSDEV
jgi:1,4-alpha-glucan branching enzyme